MLDALSDPERTHRMIARVWLADALLIDPVKVCDEPLHLLLGPESKAPVTLPEWRCQRRISRALLARSNMDCLYICMHALFRSVLVYTA